MLKFRAFHRSTRMRRRPLVLLLVPVAVTTAIVAFSVARSVGGGASRLDEQGLSDSERHSVHATAVAESGVQIRADAIAFALSGQSLDALPQAEIQSNASISTNDLREAVETADVVSLVQSEGSFVDTSTGQLYLRVRVIEGIKADNEPYLDVALMGGPQRTPTGQWVLALAPHELYLAAGEQAILLLEAEAQRGELHQRPHEAMLVTDNRVASREGFAFRSTVGGESIDDVLTLVREVSR